MSFKEGLRIANSQIIRECLQLDTKFEQLAKILSHSADLVP